MKVNYMTITPSLPLDREARRMALEAKLRPFIADMRILLKSFPPKTSKSDLARILIQECIEAGFVTDGWMSRVARDLPLKASDVSNILQDESGPDRLWHCDDEERYSLTPTA